MTASNTITTNEPTQPALSIQSPRTVALIAAGGLMLGAALPWATVHTGFGSISASGFDGGDGVLTAILGLLGALAVLSMKSWRRWTAMACGVLSVAIGMYDLINVHNKATDSDFIVSVGFGLYLTIAAGVVMAVAAFKAKTTKVEAMS